MSLGRDARVREVAIPSRTPRGPSAHGASDLVGSQVPDRVEEENTLVDVLFGARNMVLLMRRPGRTMPCLPVGYVLDSSLVKCCVLIRQGVERGGVILWEF